MPIPEYTPLEAIPRMLAATIEAYNAPGAYTTVYNDQYRNYIDARATGIATSGRLAAWVAGREAPCAIQNLLERFGMRARNSALAQLDAFQAALASIDPGTMNWVSGISLPLDLPPPALVNPATGVNLSLDLVAVYETLAAPGAVTVSGGYVAASKAMHCLFPDLAPMIDGTHSGISYYNIVRRTYAPLLGLADWDAWLGVPLDTVANPSPRGAGRNSWGSQQFVAAIGINQHIYELWQVANGKPGLPAFLALDPTPGTTGIPRIIDKGLW
jgi:hypothetical protein